MATSKKAAAKVVKDPTRYVVITLDEYRSNVVGSTCAVRETDGDGLDAAIKRAAAYNGDSYVVVAEIKKIVRVPNTGLVDVKSLANVPVEDLS